MSRNSRMADVAATGTAYADKAFLHSVVLTPAAALSTAVVRDGGGSGTVLVRLQAAASGNSAVWQANGVKANTDLHVTISGAGANVNVEYEPAD